MTYACTSSSILSNIGLKEAQEKVTDYNPLMKEFPIQDLHAANNLEAIKTAVLGIFAHLRKVRTTNYPAQRAIHLVEAISRDLNTQLLKVSVCVCVCVCVCVRMPLCVADNWHSVRTCRGEL